MTAALVLSRQGLPDLLDRMGVTHEAQRLRAQLAEARRDAAESRARIERLVASRLNAMITEARLLEALERAKADLRALSSYEGSRMRSGRLLPPPSQARKLMADEAIARIDAALR